MYKYHKKFTEKEQSGTSFIYGGHQAKVAGRQITRTILWPSKSAVVMSADFSGGLLTAIIRGQATLKLADLVALLILKSFDFRTFIYCDISFAAVLACEDIVILCSPHSPLLKENACRGRSHGVRNFGFGVD